MRPSTNEAMPGKNPNHFAGVVYQLAAEKIASDIYDLLGVRNVVYITANNGDVIASPNSVDVILEGSSATGSAQVKNIVESVLDSIPEIRTSYIRQTPIDRFMRPCGYCE